MRKMVLLIACCLLLPLYAQKATDVESLERVKIEMLDYMESFSDLIAASNESDAQSADALSQIAGEWVIHLTYVNTMLQMRDVGGAACSSRKSDHLLIDRLEKVIAAAQLSRQSVNLMLTYSNSPPLHKLSNRMLAGLTTVTERLSRVHDQLRVESLN